MRAHPYGVRFRAIEVLNRPGYPAIGSLVSKLHIQSKLVWAPDSGF
jgi:hypothetical protein